MEKSECVWGTMGFIIGPPAYAGRAPRYGSAKPQCTYLRTELSTLLPARRIRRACPCAYQHSASGDRSANGDHSANPDRLRGDHSGNSDRLRGRSFCKPRSPADQRHIPPSGPPGCLHAFPHWANWFGVSMLSPFPFFAFPLAAPTVHFYKLKH